MQKDHMCNTVCKVTAELYLTKSNTLVMIVYIQTPLN